MRRRPARSRRLSGFGRGAAGFRRANKMQNHRLLPPLNRPTRNRINFRTTPVNCPILKVFISPPEGFRNFAAAHSAGASGGVTEFQATAACQNTLRQSLGWFVRGHGINNAPVAKSVKANGPITAPVDRHILPVAAAGYALALWP